MTVGAYREVEISGGKLDEETNRGRVGTSSNKQYQLWSENGADLGQEGSGGEALPVLGGQLGERSHDLGHPAVVSIAVGEVCGRGTRFIVEKISSCANPSHPQTCGGTRTYNQGLS